MSNGLTALAFVDLAGNPIELDPTKHAKAKAKKEAGSFHNGWRVVGVPPGAMEEARKVLEGSIAAATRAAETDKSIRIPKAWDEDVWLRSYKKPAVRSKPYSVPEAAHECRELAVRSGWTFVDVVEIKKEARAT